MKALSPVARTASLFSKSHILYGPLHFEICEPLSKFIDYHINPFVDEWERQRHFPAKKLFKELGTLGVFGVNKPIEYGGLGLDFSYSVAISETMGRINCGAIPMAVAVQSDMATPALAEFGSAKLKDQFLKPTLSGDRIACLGVSEQSAGSDVAGIKTYGRFDEGDLIINGCKQWITNGHQADWICLLLNTDRNKSPHQNKSLVCVNMNEPGITLGQPIEKLGMHSSDTATIHFDNVRIPLKNIIGEEGRGFFYQMSQFQNERLVAVAVLTEPLKRAIHLTMDYVLQRQMFGGSEFDQQIVQYKLAELSAEIEALQSLLYKATYCKINSESSETETVKLASMAKFKAGRLARKVTDECLQLFGGNGYTWDNPLCRLHRDLRLFSIAAGCDEVMLSIIARILKKQHSK